MPGQARSAGEQAPGAVTPAPVGDGRGSTDLLDRELRRMLLLHRRDVLGRLARRRGRRSATAVAGGGWAAGR